MKPEEVDDLARSAYGEARKLVKSWTSMARIMTRNPRTKVILTSTGICSTNGKDIFMKTPLELGNMGPHMPELCGKRDELLIQKCQRCRGIELANIIVIHEISHIVEQTFEQVSLQEKAQILHRAIEMECNGNPDSKRAAILKKRIEEAPKQKTADYLNLLDLVSPYMPILFNAAEDVRVNRLMQEYRPGTKVMFEAMTNEIFVKGILADDGRPFKWADSPPNAQAMIGVYCKVSDFQYETWLSPEVVEDLADPGLTEVCDLMKQAPTARAMYRLVFPLLENFRRLGYFKAPDEPEDEPAPPPPPQPSDEKEEEEPQEQQPDDSNSDAGDKASEGEQGDEGSDDEENDGNDGGDSGKPGSDGGDDQDRERSETSDESDPEVQDGDSGRVDASNGESKKDCDERDPRSQSNDGDGGSTEDRTSDESSNDGADGADQGEPDLEDRGGSSEDREEDASGDGSEDHGEDEADSDCSETEPSNQQDGDDSSNHTEPGAEDNNVDDQDSEADPSESQSDGARSLEDLFGESSDDPSDGQDNPEDQPGQPPSNEEAPSTGEPSGTPEIDGKDTDSSEEAQPYTAEDQEAMGLPEMIQELLNIFGGHADKNDDGDEEARPSAVTRLENMLEDALERAIEQLEHFDAPSREILGLRKTRREDWDEGPDNRYHNPWRQDRSMRSSVELPDIPQGILTSALQRLRVAFQENRKKEYTKNLKHGKVDTRVLGRRIAIDDERLFHRKREPNKRDYFVLVGLDVSGSTSRPSEGNRDVCMLDLMKAATFAKCELLHRLGITFAVYAHSGDGDYVTIYEIKSPEEAWGRPQRESLAALQPTAANLDGHTMEFYRKVVQKRRETDRIILYYTDGAMPLENFEEELEILQREIKLCQKLGIRLVGVGVGNDDPKEHGLDTIRIDEIQEVPHVVDELRKRLQSV